MYCPRPLFFFHSLVVDCVDIVFDILYLNDTALTRYPLHERRAALHRIIRPLARRFEIHTYSQANTVPDIENELRKVVAEGCTTKDAHWLISTGSRD